MLLAVGQMLPYAVPRLLLLTIGTGRVVDAATIAGCTAEAVFELTGRGDGYAGEQNPDRRGESDDGR